MAIWGVADPIPLPTVNETVGGADVVTVPTAETPVITTAAIAAFNPGPYFPIVEGLLTIVLGAMAPASLQISFNLNGGSDVDSFVVEPGLLVALAELIVPIFLLGTNSPTAWQGAGSVVNITVLTPDNAVTVKFVGSRAIVGIMRGPDV